MAELIELRTDLMRIANMTEDDEIRLKNCCKKFAKNIVYNMDFEYYSVFFTDENYLLAKLAEPEIDRYLQRVQNG